MTASPSLRRFGLWVATTVLVPVFLVAGAAKFVFPELWADSFANQWGIPPSLVEVAGALELLGAILLLPRRTAFLGGLLIAPVMAMATTTHLMHRQWSLAGVTLVLGAMASWVAVGRRRAAEEHGAASETDAVDAASEEAAGPPDGGITSEARTPDSQGVRSGAEQAATTPLDSVDTPRRIG